MSFRSQLPEVVERRARLNGQPGVAWLEALDGTIEDLAADWRLTLRAVLPGGSESAVVEAVLADGRPAVLKVMVAGQDPELRQARVLSVGGDSYAQVYAADPARGAYLIERLGPTLHSLGWSVEAQVGTICTLLIGAWTRPPPDLALMDGAAKAEDLAGYIERSWADLERPCSRRAVDLALAYAESRGRAHTEDTAVMAHGDAHTFNTLRRLDDASRFKLIDPDPLFIEPAYDLGVLMREWGADLRRDPLGAAKARCEALSRLTGVAPEPIWRWGYVERVSTGLAALSLGLANARADYLQVAEVQSADPPF